MKLRAALLIAVLVSVGCGNEEQPMSPPEPASFEVNYSLSISPQEGSYELDRVEYLNADGDWVQVADPGTRWRLELGMLEGDEVSLRVYARVEPIAVVVINATITATREGGSPALVARDVCEIVNGEQACVLELRGSLR